VHLIRPVPGWRPQNFVVHEEEDERSKLQQMSLAGPELLHGTFGARLPECQRIKKLVGVAFARLA
jgi:hypothetical protein